MYFPAPFINNNPYKCFTYSQLRWGYFCFFLKTSTASSFLKLVHTVHTQRKLKIIKVVFKNKTITLQLVPANCIVTGLLSFTGSFGITCQNRVLFSYRPIFTSCTVIFLKTLRPHLAEPPQSTCLFFCYSPFQNGTAFSSDGL